MPIILHLKDSSRSYTSTKLDPAVRELFDVGKFDDLETLLLERLEKNPSDLDFYVPILRTMVRNKHQDRALMFLQFLIDSLVERKKAAEANALQYAALEFWPDCEYARAFLLARFKEAYGSSKNYQRFLEHTKAETSSTPLPALELLETRLLYDEGVAVYLPAKGVGRVKEINLVLDTIRIAFPGDEGFLSFKPAECRKVLEILRPGHFMLEKLEKIAGLKALAESNPRELLQKLFTSFNKALALSEIKQMLSGIVSDSGWSSFWNKAKSDPRLTSAPGNKGPYTWSDSAAQAGTKLADRFNAAGIREKINMARTEGDRSPELTKVMIDGFVLASSQFKQSDPALAFEIELAREAFLKDASADIGALISSPDIIRHTPAVADKNLRKRAYAIIRQSRSDWELLYCALLETESENQLIAYLYETLEKADHAGLEKFILDTIATPYMHPHFFGWLCKEMMDRPELKKLASWNFLQNLLTALPGDSIKAQFAQIKKAFEMDGAARYAVTLLDVEQARTLLSMLERISGLEDYLKERLRIDTLNLHPSLKEKEKERVDNTFWATPEMLDAKQVELEKLVKKDLPQNAEEIKRTRAYGDLRENFEYHAARARQELLSSRAKTLHDELALAWPLDKSGIDPSAIGVGTKVKLIPVDKGDPIEITILGPWESNSDLHIYSYQAPAVAAIISRKIGETVRFNEIDYRIDAIAPWK